MCNLNAKLGIFIKQIVDSIGNSLDIPYKVYYNCMKFSNKLNGYYVKLLLVIYIII